MGTKLEGKPVVAFLREDIKRRVEKLSEQGILPALQIIRVGEREEDISYEKRLTGFNNMSRIY